MWIIQDLGPNLIHFLESISIGFFEKSDGLFRTIWIKEYFEMNVWRDKSGVEIKAPPFLLKHSNKGWHSRTNTSIDKSHSWPPTLWSQVKSLVVSLQTAHLWVALMAMAGRQSELLSLKRDCIEFARDGELYANGKTYKLTQRFDGDEREWVLPDVAVEAIAQQVKLVQTWQKIMLMGNGIDSDGEDDFLLEENNYLWASFKGGSSSIPNQELRLLYTSLHNLAGRLGMTTKPGGVNLHPHRFRKTIARLCGIALVSSPRVLMQVFGHKDIQMTLYYILRDKSLAKEIETVAQEIRVMRCVEIIKDIREAKSHDILPNGGHGGPGIRSITKAIENHEQTLHRTGKEWGVNTAYELAVILTMGGQHWVYVRPHVLCTKGIGQPGECIKGVGSPEVSNCQSHCTNRIEEKSARRDVEKIIPILVSDYHNARMENDLMVMASLGEQIRQNIGRFDDIQAFWQNDPVVTEVLAEAV